MSRPVVRCVNDKPPYITKIQTWCIEINGVKVGTWSASKDLMKFLAEWLDENLADAIKAAKEK